MDKLGRLHEYSLYMCQPQACTYVHTDADICTITLKLSLMKLSHITHFAIYFTDFQLHNNFIGLLLKKLSLPWTGMI